MTEKNDNKSVEKVINGVTWEWKLPNKSIRTGIDSLGQLYVVLDYFSDAEKNEIYTWLDSACPEKWTSLGNTIWFISEADRTFFLVRWT